MARADLQSTFEQHSFLIENFSILSLLNSSTKVEDVISFYNFATGTLLNELSTLIKSSNGSSTWRPLITYKNILRAIENIGTEMSLGLRLFNYHYLFAYLIK